MVFLGSRPYGFCVDLHIHRSMVSVVNSGATGIVIVILSSTAVERAIAQCTSRWAMARGHRLNTSIVLAAVHGLSGLFRAVSAVEPFTLSSPPLPTLSPSLIGYLASVDVKQHESKVSVDVKQHSPNQPNYALLHRLPVRRGRRRHLTATQTSL